MAGNHAQLEVSLMTSDFEWPRVRDAQPQHRKLLIAGAQVHERWDNAQKGKLHPTEQQKNAALKMCDPQTTMRRQGCRIQR